MRQGTAVFSLVFLSLLLPFQLLGQGVFAPPSTDWVPIGPPGGSVAALAFDPSDHSQIYAVTSSGSSLLFKSTDAGQTWQKIAVFSQQVFDVQVSASRPNLLYALGFDHVLKSADAGITWTSTHLPYLCAGDGGRLAIDPSNPDVVLATGREHYDWPEQHYAPAVFRSTDGNISWTPAYLSLQAGIAHGVSINPLLPSEIYIGVGFENGAGGGIFKSVNGGLSWAALIYISDGTFGAVLVDPVNPGRVYAGTERNVFRSSNAGITWTANAGQISGLSLAFGQGNPNVLFAGGTGHVYRSTDGGANWAPSRLGPAGSCLSLIAAGNKAYAGSASGLFLSTDAGATWQDSMSGFVASGVRGLASAPSYPSILYTATEDAIWRSENCGNTWQRLPAIAGIIKVERMAVRPDNPDDLWVVARNYLSPDGPFTINLYRSGNGGQAWQEVLHGSYYDVFFNPVQPDHIFVGAWMLGDMAIAVSLDGGATFTSHLVGAAGLGEVLAVGIDPQNDNLIYAGGAYWTGTAYEAGIFKSLDGGLTWANMTSPLFAGWGFIHKISVDPLRPNVVFLRHNMGLYKSLDGGANWTKIAPFDTSDFAVDPESPAEICAVGADDFYESRDGGETWDSMSEGLEFQNIVSVNILPRFKSFFAGTSGGGLFRRRQLDLIGLSLFCGAGGEIRPEPGLYAFPSGAEVQISAVPAAGYKFRGWEGDTAGTINPLNVAMDDDKSVRARFWLAAPTGFAGAQKSARSLFLVQNINVLTWLPISGIPDVRKYRVYRLGAGAPVLLAELGPNVGTYWDRAAPKDGPSRYTLVAVNPSGEEGEPASVNVGALPARQKISAPLLRRK